MQLHKCHAQDYHQHSAVITADLLALHRNLNKEKKAERNTNVIETYSQAPMCLHSLRPWYIHQPSYEEHCGLYCLIDVATL